MSYFIKQGAFNQRNNPWSYKRDNFITAKTDDFLFGANERFDVTSEYFDTDGNLLGTLGVASLFNMDYNSYGLHPLDGEVAVITIRPKDYTEAKSLITYCSGKIFLSFYYILYPNDGDVTVSFKLPNETLFTDVVASRYNNVSQLLYVDVPAKYVNYINTIKITIRGRSVMEGSGIKGCYPSEIVWVRNRAEVEQESVIVKHAINQEIYGHLTAPKFITKGGTSSQIHNGDGSLSDNLSIARGGTGATTAIGAEFNILNQVQDINATLNDNRKIALCNETKSSTNGVFRWLKMSNVWTYIKGKIDSAYSAVLGSGITSGKVSSYDTHIADGTKHTTSAEKATWNGKADAVHTHTKGQVGLGNVDNTSDADKPVSTAQQAAFDAMQSDIDDKAEYAGEPTITKGMFTLYPCGEMEAVTSYTLPSGPLYSLKSFLSAVLNYASYGSIELKVGSNSMRGVLSLVRGNNTANIESHPNQTTTNVTCTLPKDGGTLLTGANLPTSLKNPYKLKINGQEYDGSSEKEIPVDSNPTQNSTALVKSGGVYSALNGKADSSELSNYYLKTDTVDKAKKATNATYAEEADFATYDIAGDQINLTYLKKSGGVMSGDLKVSDASIRTTKLQDGDKMLEYSELTKSSTQPYTGRNLIGAHGGSGANVQTIIRSGGDLIHRRGNDSTKNDTTILDTSNVGRLLYKGPSLLGYIRNSTDNRGKSRPFFSVDVKEIIGSTDVVLCFIVERMAVGSTSRSSTQTLKIQIRRGSNGLLQTMYRSRKVDFGVDIKMYSYLDDATNKLYVYIDVEDNYTNTFLYPHHFASHLGTERFDIYVGFDNGGSSFSPSEIPIS